MFMKIKVTYGVFVALIWSLAACQQNYEQQSVDEKLLAEGKVLIETKCQSCHTLPGSDMPRLAPPFKAVKNHYMDENTSYETFHAGIEAFLKNPSLETSEMPGAVNKFGLMPKLALSDQEIEAIAYYLFYKNLNKKDGKGHAKKGKKGDQVNHPEELKNGMKFALQTKKALGKNLMKAINDGGSAYAVQFCNTRALPITDSMATELGVQIRRVSDKARNPDNQANETELDIIRKMKMSLAETGNAHGQYDSISRIGYYPIMTNALCTQCHGTEQDINEETRQILSKLYPNDKATGYTENQLRGIWVVEEKKTTDKE
jgi:mono/diheme cytochrome c family protein